VSVTMTLSDLERPDARREIFFRRISVIMLVPFWPRVTKFGTVTHGRMVYF